MADFLAYKHEYGSSIERSFYATLDVISFPGNEYWIGALTASGDPAAACCSTIAELQNSLINPHIAGKYLQSFK